MWEALFDNLIIALWVGVAVFGAIFWILKTKVTKILYRQALKHNGFEEMTFNFGWLPKNADITMSMHVSQTMESFVGWHNGLRTWYFHFETGKGGNTVKYAGVLFETEETFHNLEIIDTQSAFKPFFSFPKKTESNEFDQAFLVYASDPKHPYYQLSPSAMSALLNLRKKSDPIVTAFFENKFIFFRRNNRQTEEFLQIEELLSQEPTEAHIKAAANNVLFNIADAYAVYESIKK